MLQEPKPDFNFNDITLGPPNGLQGGSYFTKLLIKGEPLYLQIPKCTTKQGLVVTEKKKYCDLMFSRDAADVISWFENIERHVQQLMFSKKNIWFHDDLEFSDIENAFTSPIRSYKSGNNYLVRCVIPKVISPETISCFNENEEPIDLAQLNEENVEIIPLVELQGVRFSSKNFQIEISLRQLMVIKKKELFKRCLIRMRDNSEEDNESVETKKTVSVDTQQEEVDTQKENMETEQEQVDTQKENMETEQEQVDTQQEEVDTQQEEVDTQQEQDDAHQEPVERDIKPEDYVKNDNTRQDKDNVIQLEQTEIQEEEISGQQEQVEEVLEPPSILEPIEVSLEDIKIENQEDNLTLKRPNEVYYTMWREARQKARLAKQEALAAYLEAKKIKENYMLEGINSDSDEEEMENQQHLA